MLQMNLVIHTKNIYHASNTTTGLIMAVAAIGIALGCWVAGKISGNEAKKGLILIGIGGVAKKSPFIMQMMADVMNMPIRIHRSEQTCALGAAMFAATAAGLYSTVEEAMKAMGQGFETTYTPDAKRTGIYAEGYRKYKALGAFTASMNID